MGHSDKRAAVRFPTDLEADCRMAGEAWAARLRNISTTGCMMATPDGGLPSGWMMRLRISGLPAIDAEIIWRHRGHAGLRFLLPLHPEAMEHLGFRLPENRPSLHAELIKRAPPEERLAPGSPAQVRGAPQPLS